MAIASATAMCVPATLLANSTPRNCVNHQERDKRLGIRSSVKYTLCWVKVFQRRVSSKTRTSRVSRPWKTGWIEPGIDRSIDSSVRERKTFASRRSKSVRTKNLSRLIHRVWISECDFFFDLSFEDSKCYEGWNTRRWTMNDPSHANWRMVCKKVEIDRGIRMQRSLSLFRFDIMVYRVFRLAKYPMETDNVGNVLANQMNRNTIVGNITRLGYPKRSVLKRNSIFESSWGRRKIDLENLYANDRTLM